MRHKNTPATRNFDWSSRGLPDPESPAAQHFDWSALDMPNPNSPAGRHFDYCAQHEWGNTLLDAFMKLSGWGKSSAVWILSEFLKLVGVNVSIQAALLSHYVAGTGQPVDLNTWGPIPEPWQAWIESQTQGRRGTYSHINGENAQLAGLDDLSDSLGHFTVIVSQKTGSNANVYEIRKEGTEQYQFGFDPNDRQRKHRHGFRIPLKDSYVSFIRSHLMPTRMYDYGRARHDEQFRIAKEMIHGQAKWVVYVPWQVLVDAGKPFYVRGRFER